MSDPSDRPPEPSETPDAAPAPSPAPWAAPTVRFARDSLEFGRVVNLSDAVFAISLTLLVLTLEGLAVTGLISFALAFFLVGSVWWHHHRIVARLAFFDPGLVALTLVLLAGIALAPLPTRLVGEDPRSPVAVVSFIGLFAVLSSLSLLFIVRAHRVGAWREPLSPALFRWILLDWGTSLGILLATLGVAVRWPVTALVVLTVLSIVGTAATAALGPRERRRWF
jgi:uncharacterized membrane protein